MYEKAQNPMKRKDQSVYPFFNALSRTFPSIRLTRYANTTRILDIFTRIDPVLPEKDKANVSSISDTTNKLIDLMFMLILRPLMEFLPVESF